MEVKEDVLENNSYVSVDLPNGYNSHDDSEITVAYPFN